VGSFFFAKRPAQLLYPCFDGSNELVETVLGIVAADVRREASFEGADGWLGQHPNNI